jgi:IS30 family transposase
MSKHLTAGERETVSQLLFSGIKPAEIARRIGRHPGTISRELARNRQDGQYSSVRAQQMARQRRTERPLERKMDHPKTNQMVRNGLVKNWSPEQISGRIRMEKSEGIRTVSRQTIHRWIEQDEDRDHWQSFLRRRGKRRPKDDRRGHLPGVVKISGRPEAANNRSRLGDWEGDTIVSPRKGSGLLTLADRKSGYVKIRKLDNLRAETTRSATEKAIGSLPEDRCYTVTFDQGKEFAKLIGANKLFPEGVYFAHPGCPWERGTNENTNGLIRQFLPKGTDISKCTHQEIRKIEESCNNRPRKRLAWRTPAEVFLENQPTTRCA